MPQGGNRRHLRSLARTFAVYTQLTLKAAPQVPTIGRPFFAKSNLCRGGVSPPVCREFYLTSRRRTSEPPLCKGRCRAERGTGVVPDTNYLYFFPANSNLLQSLRRSRASSLREGAFTPHPPLGRSAFSCRRRREHALFSVRGIPSAPAFKILPDKRNCGGD